MAVRVRRRYASGSARDPGHDAAHEPFRRAVPVLEPDGRRRRLRRGPPAVSRSRARRRLRQGHAGRGVRSARHDGDDLRLRARPGRESRPTARAGHRRPDRAGSDGAQLRGRSRCARPERPGATCATCCVTCRWRSTRGCCPAGSATSPASRFSRGARDEVPLGNDAIYGMGLMVDTTYDVPVVHHGGDMIGYHSDMIWLPEQKVGAVVLTSGDPGWTLRSQFRRKLLEVLFDGRAEAGAQVEASAKAYYDSLASERKLLTAPADPAESTKLAPATRTRRSVRSTPAARRASRSSTSASGGAKWPRARTPTAPSRS